MALRIDYNQLTALTAQMDRAAQKVMTTYESMEATVNSLVNDGLMEAEAATTYVNNFTSLLGPSMTDLNTLLVSFSKQLNTICDNFAEVDKAIAGAIGV